MQFFRNISGGGEPPPPPPPSQQPSGSADDSLLARAVAIIEVATQHDNRKEYAAALREYERGTQILLDALKRMPDGDRKAALRLKAIEYIERALERFGALDFMCYGRVGAARLTHRCQRLLSGLRRAIDRDVRHRNGSTH